MEIVCDDRESKVFNCADGMDNVSSQRLTTGDYLIGFRTPEGSFRALVVVERKTWVDLAASIKDGRVGNIQKLREYRDETGARIAYLLEGSPPKNPTTLIGGIPYKSLRAHLDHLLYTDSIIELKSSGPRASLDRMLEFARNLKQYAAASSSSSTADHLDSATRKRPAATEEYISDSIWGSIRGISVTTARAFRPYKVSQLYNGDLDHETVSNLMINGRHFGKARAKQLLDYIETQPFLKEILNAVPSMGARRVALLMAAVGERPRRMFEEWPTIRATKCITESCFATVERCLMQKQ